MLNDLRYSLPSFQKPRLHRRGGALARTRHRCEHSALQCVDAMLLKMLPVKDPERLVLFRSDGSAGVQSGLLLRQRQ